MASRKRRSEALEEQPAKVARKERGFVSLSDKMEVITRTERGDDVSTVCEAMNLAPAVVESILKNKDRIKKSYASTIHVTPTRAVQDEVVKTDVKAPEPQTESGRERKTARASASNSRKPMSGQKKKNAETAEDEVRRPVVDTEAASKFTVQFKQVINEEGYSPDLVFNAVDTGLFWKIMPPKSYISREEQFSPGFKASKDFLRLILGSNASGTLKLTPLVVYHTETPRAMIGILKTHLPVTWRSNKKVAVTQSIFSEWYSYFCSAVAQFCAERKLPAKALLLLDNTLGHSTNLNDITSAVNVKVLCLPPNTSTILQPMEQEVVTTFRAFYHRNILKDLVQEMAVSGVTLHDYWNKYNILKGLDHISSAWEEIPASLLNPSWEKLCPRISTFTSSGADQLQVLTQEICKLSHEAGMGKVKPEDVRELLAGHSLPLSEADLQQLAQLQKVEEHQEEDDSEIRSMETGQIQRAMAGIMEQCKVLWGMDPDFGRSRTVWRSVTLALEPYYQILRERRAKNMSMKSHDYYS